jgi:hypothetical protein
MPENVQIGPDLARCFGHYRAQSARYALLFCVRCPKVKACVQTAWGTGDARPARRRAARWEDSTQLGVRSSQPPRPRPEGYWLAT